MSDLHAEFQDTRIQRSAAERNAKCIRAFDTVLEASGLTKNTRQSYVNFATRFSEFIGAKSFAEITVPDVSQFRVFLFKQGFSSKSQAAAFFALRKLYKVLMLADVVSWSPPHMLPMRKVGKRLPKSLTEKQVKMLLAAPHPPRDLALLEFLYGTGCRPAEVSKMQVTDLSLAAGTAKVRDGKDGDRIVCFGRFAARALKKYLNGRTSGPLFLSEPKRQRGRLLFVDGYRRTYWRAFWREWQELPDGTIARVARSAFLGRLKELPTKQHAKAALRAFLTKRLQDQEQQLLASIAESDKHGKALTTRSIGRIVKQTGLRAGLGNSVYPYQLRHSFATHCLHRGMGLRYLQHLMGHEHSGTTQVYLHSTPDDLLRSHRKFFKEVGHA